MSVIYLDNGKGNLYAISGSGAGTTGDPFVLAVGASSGTVTAGPVQGSLTDRSGTITLGGTSQQLAAANATRSYLLVQNHSDTDCWINFGVAAVATQPSIKLAANGGSYEMTTFVSTQAVNIIGATTGKVFTAKEAG